MLTTGIRSAAARLRITPQEYELRRRAAERWCSLGRHWVRAWLMHPAQGNCRACDAARKRAAYRAAAGGKP